MITYSLAEARRFTQPRGTRLVLVSCVALVGLVLVVQAARGQQPSLHDDLGDALTGAGTAFVFVAVAAGASAVAKEYSSGALVMLLTWEPRRGRVLLGKAFATGAGRASPRSSLPHQWRSDSPSRRRRRAKAGRSTGRGRQLTSPRWACSASGPRRPVLSEQC